MRVGVPLRIKEHPGLSVQEWTALIETEMMRNLDTLNAETMSRDHGKFTELLSGKVGVGGPYDWWRRFKAWIRGHQVRPFARRGGREAVIVFVDLPRLRRVACPALSVEHVPYSVHRPTSVTTECRSNLRAHSGTQRGTRHRGVPRIRARLAEG
ncbi:MAG: hypothetical protein U0792_02880 [Gemmataceae bacterium]